MRKGGAVAALLIWGSLDAAPADPWLRLNSAHFELFTTAGEHAGREALRHFERVRSFFQQAFGLTPHGAHPVRIVAFRTAREYDPYRFNQVAEAYFTSGYHHDFIVMQSASAEHYSMAVHEYTHLLIHQMGRVPQWLNEGLAELYSNLEVRETGVLVGKPIDGRAAVLATQPWLPLREVVAVDERSPLYNETSHAGVFYAESWFLVHMLALQEWYAPRFRQLGAALLEGDTASAFLKVYGKSVEQVQQDLQLYFRSPRLSGRIFQVKLDDSKEATLERGGWEARATLAELLNGLPNHREEAHGACEELERDFPNRWENEQYCAEVFWRDHNLVDASLRFARAVELAPAQSRLRVEYAALLSAEGRFGDAAAQLRQAADTGAEDDIRYELAVALVQAGNFRDAIDEFSRIKTLPKEQALRYYYHLAAAHLGIGDTAGAEKLITQAEPLARTDQERKALEELRAKCK